MERLGILRLEVIRPWSWALADRLSFLVECFAVAVLVLLTLSWAILGFSWQTTAHEWGSFWGHYAKASAVARRPVETILGAVLGLSWLATIAIRFRKSRLSWSAWPARSSLIQETSHD